MLWFENRNISIFSSQKSDGDFLFKTDFPRLNQKVKQNRLKFFKKHKIDPRRLVNLAGIHGVNIDTITCDSILGNGSLNPDTRIKNTDGLITNIKNSYLMVTGADCFPVLFYDEKNKAIGAMHAGWKGLLKEIAAEMLKKFVTDFSTDPANLSVWMGPGIKSCHFEVKNDVGALFEKNYKNEIIERDGRTFIDLPKIIKVQLTALGVQPEKIVEHPDCTFCGKDKYFSYRRDKPKVIHSNAYIIHLK
ncbi:peptidoglycan editing factor PgeF [Candidatus Wolfebacteria bacterium]|nr:peptidoglycan editing factor PgeF [Candidatus Wolfebacteria bacterium]